MKTILFTCTTLASLSLAIAPLALHAQTTNTPPGQPQVAARPERVFLDGRFAQAGTQQNQVLRVLTDEQLASFRQVMETQRENTREIETKLIQARKELTAVSIAEKFDEKDVRTKAIAVANLEAETAVLRAKAISQIKPPLSAVQIEKLKNPPAAATVLRPRLNGAGDGTNAAASSIRPPMRLPQRDSNDLPAPPPSVKP